MGRRIRPKTRPRPTSDGESAGTRIKIRMRRESSDTIESLINVAKKEAAKEANFKGFKSGKKVGAQAEKKKTEKVEQRLEIMGRQLTNENQLTTKLSARLRAVEKALSEMAHTFTENNFDTRLLLKLNDSGVPMRSSDEHGMLAINKWLFSWQDATGVVRDEDGVDRSMSVMQRHRLHPGHRIPIREMWPIWNAVSTSERPDIDPIQGMRGAWYYNTRRYSTHSSAMNAWRRHIHNKRIAQSEIAARSALMPEPESEDEPELYEESDNVDEMNADGTPYTDEETLTHANRGSVERERLTRNWRNRINSFLRSCELESCRYWTRHYSERAGIIEANDNPTPFNRVCASFAVPLYDWDGGNWTAFRQSVNYYMEVSQNSSPHEAGEPRPRRRGRRAVTRTETNTRRRERYSSGYNRENY